MLKKIALYALAGILLAAVAAWWGFSRAALKSNPPLAAPPNSKSSTAGVAAGARADSIDVLAERLRARLEKEPGDVDGWVLLARSYHYLQRWDDAKAAFAKAKSLGYRGETDSTTDDAAATQVASAAPDPIFEAVARVQDQAAQLQTGVADGSSIKSSAVEVRVSVDPALQTAAGIDSTVFIFARAAQGPRMPLAAVRKTLRDLPIDIRLDDSLAMLPNNKLSDAATIVIGARISRSGNAVAQPDDIEVLSPPLSDWRGQHVQLILSHNR